VSLEIPVTAVLVLLLAVELVTLALSRLGGEPDEGRIVPGWRRRGHR
jgi:hypothetical protein